VSIETDLSALTDAELVQLFVDTVKFRSTITHVGRRNRLVDHIGRISDALESRDHALKSLRDLLGHPDREVRYSAACRFQKIDGAVFKQILSDLAEGDDDVAFEAGFVLRQDADDEDAQNDVTSTSDAAPPPDDELSYEWQCDHPPPAAMTLAQIRRRLARTMSATFAGRVQSLTRPAVGLWPQRPRGELPVTASRLGGIPRAPPGWSWPLCETEPMFFLGQINCAEVRGIPGAEALPPSGLLAFFGDHDAVNGCTPPSEKAFAVFHWDDPSRLVPASPPIELQTVYPLCGLVFRPLIDLPDEFSNVIESLEWGEGDRDAYFELMEAMRERGRPEDVEGCWSLSKLFGWPHLVQNDLEEMGDPGGPNGMRLLLQLDDYSNGTESAEWGGSGSLYFLISDADLRERRFDRCKFEMQDS
jgi:uncharacterized protein YwqG